MAGPGWLFWKLLKYPLIGLPVFLALAAFGAYAAYHVWDNDRKASADPVPMTLEEAITRSKNSKFRVALINTDSLQWHCDSIVYVGNKSAERMDVVVTDPLETTVMVVELPTPLSCNEMLRDLPALSGELRHLKSSDYDHYDDEGKRLSKYQYATNYLALCTYCDINNSTQLIVLALMLMAFGLIFGFVCFYDGVILKRFRNVE